MVEGGEDWHGLETTKLKSLAKLFKNRYIAIPQPRSQGLSSYRLGRARRDPGSKMRDPGNEVTYSIQLCL